jgi:DNA-binding IclR family transcriptional regulator
MSAHSKLTSDQRRTATELPKRPSRGNYGQQNAGRGRRTRGQNAASTTNAFKSLERALAVLKCFDEASLFMSAQEIAARVGIPRPSVYRFLKTLCENGFLIEVGDAERRRYAIGSSILELSRLALGQTELRRLARPIMQLVAEKTGESAYLSIRQGAQAVCIENIDAFAPLRYGGRVGNTYPLYAGSPKVILAFLDPKLREHLIAQMDFKPITKYTITSRKELARRLATIQRRGFEVSNGEMFSETCAVGAPIFDENNNAIAVLSIGAPRSRITPKNRDEIGRIVVTGARDITMSYRRQGDNDPTERPPRKS